MDSKIDLNQADRDTLAGLPGIGEKLAGRMIEYRETVRPFSSVKELTAVSGISEDMMLEIEDQLTVTAVPEADAIKAVEEPAEEEVADESAVVEIAAADNMADEMPAAPAALPEPEQPSDPSPPPAPARYGFMGLVLTAVFGALMGTLLTLAILWLLNGSLQLNETAQMNAFEQQSVQAAATAKVVQSSVRTDLESVSTQAAALATRENELTAALATAQTGLETTHNSLADTIDEVAALETAADGLDKRIWAVAASAENFDAFMIGMRDLLWVLQGPPATPEAGFINPTPTATATETATPPMQATERSTPIATRTPRPTATPLREALPTSTPTES